MKVKNLRDILTIVFKLIINILLYNSILFINNYFIKSKLVITLKDREIIIYRIIKLNRLDFLKLLIEIK